MVEDGVEFPGCQRRMEEAGGRRGCSSLVDAAVLPVGEEGDAVACAHDLGQVVLEFAERQILVNDLGHVESWLYLERQMSDDTKRSKTYNTRGKAIAVLIAREHVDRSIGGDQLHRLHGSREIAV